MSTYTCMSIREHSIILDMFGGKVVEIGLIFLTGTLNVIIPVQNSLHFKCTYRQYIVFKLAIYFTVIHIKQINREFTKTYSWRKIYIILISKLNLNNRNEYKNIKIINRNKIIQRHNPLKIVNSNLYYILKVK